MIKQISIVVLLLIFTTSADFVIKGKVKKRNTVIKINESSPPRCYVNNSVFRNNDTLRRIVFAAKYIFTGKISSEVNKRRGVKRKLFKVLVRRVLKGDFSDLSDVFNVETRTFNSSNRAFVTVDGGRWKRNCWSQQGSAALLFSKDESSSTLKLLIDPVPMNLDNVRRVKALLRGIELYKILNG